MVGPLIGVGPPEPLRKNALFFHKRKNRPKNINTVFSYVVRPLKKNLHFSVVFRNSFMPIVNYIYFHTYSIGIVAILCENNLHFLFLWYFKYLITQILDLLWKIFNFFRMVKAEGRKKSVWFDVPGNHDKFDVNSTSDQVKIWDYLV